MCAWDPAGAAHDAHVRKSEASFRAGGSRWESRLRGGMGHSAPIDAPRAVLARSAALAPGAILRPSFASHTRSQWIRSAGVKQGGVQHVTRQRGERRRGWDGNGERAQSEGSWAGEARAHTALAGPWSALRRVSRAFPRPTPLALLSPVALSARRFLPTRSLYCLKASRRDALYRQTHVSAVICGTRPGSAVSGGGYPSSPQRYFSSD